VAFSNKTASYLRHPHQYHCRHDTTTTTAVALSFQDR
jgi:hypothetical protein